MTAQVGWQGPDPEPGPAPGISFASAGARLVAYIVDVIVTLLLSLALGIASVALIVVLPVLAIVPLLAIFIVSFLYFPYFWQRNGQTPGMQMMGIKVVRDSDGGPITWGTALLRLIGYWISGFVFYIGYIWVFIDKRKRGWHDLIAGTVVIEASSR